MSAMEIFGGHVRGGDKCPARITYKSRDFITLPASKLTIVREKCRKVRYMIGNLYIVALEGIYVSRNIY